MTTQRENEGGQGRRPDVPQPAEERVTSAAPAGSEPQPLPVGGSLAERALERVRPLLEALPEEASRTFNRSATTAAANLMRAEALFRPHQEAVARALPGLFAEEGAFVPLPVRAGALLQADAVLQLAQASGSGAWTEEAEELRSFLLRGASFLWGADPEVAPKLEAIVSGRGHEDRAGDLATLASLHAERWEASRLLPGMTRARLERAEQVALEVLGGLGDQPQDVEVERLRVQRNRAGWFAEAGLAWVRAGLTLAFPYQPEILEGFPLRLGARLRRPRRRAAEDGAEVEVATEAAEVSETAEVFDAAVAPGAAVVEVDAFAEDAAPPSAESSTPPRVADPSAPLRALEAEAGDEGGDGFAETA